MTYPCTQSRKPHCCGADAPKPAGPHSCGATQALVPEAANCWADAPKPRWSNIDPTKVSQALVKCSRREKLDKGYGGGRSDRDFPSKTSRGMENIPRPEPPPPLQGTGREGDGHGGNGEKRMVENGSRIFHPPLALGLKISPALKFHNFLSGGPSCNFARAVSNGLAFNTPLTLRATRAGF